MKKFHAGSRKPPMLPPDAGAHKFERISGVQSASDLSFHFTGGKREKLAQLLWVPF